MVLTGPPGIGKTRLAEAVAAMSRAAGWAVAESRCADDAGAPPLWPWTQAFEQLGQDPPAPVAGDGGADADAARFRLFQDVRARLVAATREQPVLVVLDDLQGADETSVQLLALLARHLPKVPLLVVVTVRSVGEDLPEAVADCLARLAREPAAVTLTLDGLSTDDVGSLLAA